MKKFSLIVLAVLLLSGLTSCQQEEIDPARVFQIYYIGKAEKKVEIQDYVMESESLSARLEELIRCLGTIPSKLEYKAPLNMGFALLEYELENGKIVLDVSGEYRELSTTTEVLVRAAIVKTLTQLPEVNFVQITVEGNPLYDNLDQVVGWMSGDQFLNNPGSEINSYEDIRLTLYFANETGDSLITAYRTRPYNGNVSMERLVVEELIKGANREGAYNTINPDTKIISVMVKDGICYVNLDDSFLNTVYNVTADVTIYSIVNSLAELSSVNKVQIMINGDNTLTYREKYSFSTAFERNLDMVSTVSN